jgi:uncharacterized protein involved in type VI secretion and phage assembly
MIRFEDKKGSEDLFIHAENTQTNSVKGNQSISVGGKRDVTVTKQDTENYDGQREVNVKTPCSTCTTPTSSWTTSRRSSSSMRAPRR